MKRLSCLLLALVLTVSSLAGLSLAAEPEQPELPVLQTETADGQTESAEPTQEGSALRALPMQPHFWDIPESAWYYEPVKQAYEQDLMSGVSDEQFGPKRSMTRGMFVTVLGKVAQVDSGLYRGETAFADVRAAAYYAPFVNWAQQNGFVSGVDEERFAPDLPVTREQAAVMLGHYITQMELLDTQPPETPDYADTDKISDWAQSGVACLQTAGLMVGDNNGCFNPKKQINRAEAATVFVRLNALLYGENVVQVHVWLDRDPPPEILSDTEIALIATAYHLTQTDAAYQALESINTVYAYKIPTYQRLQPMLFVFEGCGLVSDPSKRMDAMAVLVKNGRVVFLDRYSTTLPDYPFDPVMNDDDTTMPTMKAGIFRVSAVNHKGYAAWHVHDCAVVRFTNRYTYFDSVSYWIRVHRRTKDELAPFGGSWVNSSGCILIGRSGAEPSDPYAQFLQAIGLIHAGERGDVPYQNDVDGLFVLDRRFADSYLADVGYPPAARKLLGCP